MTDDDKPDATRPEQKGTSAPSISLPKGGGAIRGIGEKFGVNAATGTGSTSVPIATSPGRSGFGPKLSLSYDSGSGNGPFGFGWSLDLPQITRRTDKGLPRYHDAQGTDADSDIFLLSHAEDLVPLLQPDGSRFVDITSAPGYTIHRYRPRIEGLFARIERWTRRSDGDIHWRSITRDNVLNLYGKDAHARIADPADPRRVFTWLMCETRDDRGNAVLYDHKPEDGAGVDLTRAHERNRGTADDPRRTANRYLKRVRYGNRVSLLDDAGQRPRFLTDAQIEGAGWMFELVLDYGEHDRDAPTPADRGSWTTRFDAFSTYRAAFEIRTRRLCQRALMFHHFPGEPGVGGDSLVRSTDFRYSAPQDPAHPDAPVYSFLNAVTQVGYRRRDDGSYLKRSMPPVDYEYTQPVVQDRLQTVDADSLQNLPTGLDGTAYRWVDLHGEGIPGILTEQGGAWFYKRNVSPISDRPVAFTPVERVPIQPNLALAGGQAQFMDLASDGIPDLVVMDGPMPGFYRHDDREGWEPFRSFRSRLNRDTRDPNVKFLDVDGDGLIDVLITEDDAFVWHPSLGAQGYGPARRVRKVLDPHEERGPRLLFDDAAQSIYLADMSGDGLTDLVRIRNGEVCYWPNLGYGHFGAKVTMDRSPFSDHAEQFDQQRVRLADIDGSGTTDIIYLHREGVRLYFNESGNGFSAPRTLRVFPRVDDLASIAAVDLFANGTACLVWSSPLPNDAARPMRFVDLMGGDKPHLLVKSVNHLGAETRVNYASSTRFYLQDKHAGTPWVTRLPFPVHVVERVETVDAVSGNRFVTRYSYHHGFYDGVEREFRGFGRIDQIDTEEFAALTAGGTLPPATNEDPASQVPPVLTRTWFHTGIFLGRDHVSDFFAGLLDPRDVGEYYREPGLTDAEARQRLLPDTVLPSDLTLEEEREACRSLKGTMLRQEVYAVDGTAKAGIPYTVTEQNFTVVRVQPFGGNRHAVFFTHPREAVTTHCERDPADPRIGHALTLDVDDFGNVRKALAIAYGRRAPSTDPELTDADRAKQAQIQITRTDNRFTSADLLSIDHYRAPIAAEARTYELTGFTPENDAERFRFDEWARDDFARLLSGAVIPYEQTPDRIAKQQRLIEDVRTVYRKDDLTALSPLGEVESLALPGQSYKLALTPGVIASAFKRARAGQPDEDLLPDPAPLLEGKGADQGGYVAIDGNWWVPSSLAFYDPGADAADPARTAARELGTARQHFFLPRKMVDPFGHGSIVEYDAHDLLLVRTVDALDNTISAVNDYRVLQPALVTDANRNRAAAAFDALGMMVATAVMGKDGETLGDLLEGFDADPALADLQAFVVDPQTAAPSLLGKATTRFVHDLDRFQRAGQPVFAAALMRETHFHDPGGTSTRIQIGFSYSDGFGREIQRKDQAEGGDAPERQVPQQLPGGDVRPGDLVRDAQGNLVQADTPDRWVGSGRTVFNNKGKPIKQYEPFFSATQLYEPERDLTDTGVSPVLFYDPVGRVVATLQPDHTYEKVVFNAWIQASHDANDTIAANGTQTGDPRTDPDTAGFVHAYFQSQPPTWQTWYAQRIDNQLGPAERDAARKAAAHANTPAVEHLDALGRPFATIAHNRFSRGDIAVEEGIASRVELDIESNQREVIDADSRVVMRHDYNQLGVRIHQASMDAGERWTLSDVANKPIRTFDSRGFARRMTYDELRRPTGLFVTQNGVERLAERTVYGEAEGDAVNQRAQVHRLFDAAGVVSHEAYDFKGNLLSTRRDLLRDFQQAVDWLREPIADDGSFTSHTTYDALNRAITATAPDGSILRPTFNRARLPDRLEMNLRGATIATPFITNIDYDAKGRRVRIAYANGALTSYEYDPLTFRLSHLQTTRSAGRDDVASLLFRSASTVQDLRYTYDPTGNITSIADAAVKTVFHGNQQVDATGRYTYDAIYRLIEAQGREHIAQTAFDFQPVNGNFRDFPFLGIRLDPSDLQALRNYTEQYEYDSVGNFQVLRHRSATGSWTRRYEYQESSLLEDNHKNNRLTRTLIGNKFNHTEPVTYDAHGNTTSMTHLAAMTWNYKNEFQQADLRGGGTVFYVYDASGKRTRKVIVSQNGTRRAERIYLGGFEIHREYGGNGTAIVLERESLHVLDGKQRAALVETQTVKGGSPVDAPEPRQRYQFDNHLRSTNVELDQDGALISYEEYTPYGTTSFQVENGAAEVSAKRYRYTGQERDEESGLSYHGTRYYACWLGRWTSADPAGLVDGPDLYRYARANPVRFNDPGGQQPPDPASFATLESFIEASPAPYSIEYLQSVWEATHGPMTPSVARTITYTAARAEANAGARAYRALEGMAGPEVQAGHTIAARHVPLSGISEAAANAPETFMQLQSRHGQGMSVMVEGHPNPLTPHNAQELLIDAAVERARQANGGVLTPTAHQASGAEVRWRLQGTGFDQREADLKRASGPFDEAAAIERASVQRAAQTAAVPSEVTAVEQAAETAARTEAGPAALLSSAGGEISLLKQAAGGVTPGRALFALNLYFAWESYRFGTRPNTPAPVGNGMIGGSQGEGILNAAGTLAGGAPAGTMLRQAAELGSAVHDPGKLWDAVKSGASPTSIGMGIFFGAFR
jgi:RHS repeat-associated protein